MNDDRQPSLATDGPISTTHLGDLLVNPDYVDILREAGLDSLDSLFRGDLGQRLHKPGLSPWRERIRIDIEPPEGPRTFFLKRFLNPPKEAWRTVAVPRRGMASLAAVEWNRTIQLRAEGVPCAEPVAFGEELAGSRELRSALLLAAVPGDALERLVGEWGAEDRPLVRALLEATADLVGRFHALGYVHRDLYLSHIFFDADARLESALSLIDLQRVMKPPRWRRRRWVVKDLASLDYSTPASLVSRGQRLRWLKRYLRVSKLKGSPRRLARQVARKTLRIVRHDRRRGGNTPVGSLIR